MKSIKYLFVIYYLVSFSQGQVIMTEVMYDLVGTDSPNEFVELFNLSQTDTADLSGYRIKDKLSEDTLVDSGFGLRIPPQSYALIFEGDYSLSGGIYSDSIPGNTILIKVDDFRIGIYIVKTTARDGSSGQLWENVQTVVLAKPL